MRSKFKLIVSLSNQLPLYMAIALGILLSSILLATNVSEVSLKRNALFSIIPFLAGIGFGYYSGIPIKNFIFFNLEILENNIATKVCSGYSSKNRNPLLVFSAFFSVILSLVYFWITMNLISIIPFIIYLLACLLFATSVYLIACCILIGIVAFYNNWKFINQQYNE